MQLECTSVGGNPLAQVAWERNGELVDFNFTTRNNKAVNALTFVAKPADNGAVFVCKAWNVVNADTPLRANRSLIVHCKYADIMLTHQHNIFLFLYLKIVLK